MLHLTNIALVVPRQTKPSCRNNCRVRCLAKFNKEGKTAIFRKYWELDDAVK